MQVDDIPASFEPKGGSVHPTIDESRDRLNAKNVAKATDFSIDGTTKSSERLALSLPCRFGEYVLESVLGRGGMGVVYLATQTKLDRKVAIKMIRSGGLATENEIERFYTEARSAAKLQHPNIVAVHQCGEVDGHHYFSMDYIAGVDLSAKISKNSLTPNEAARYVRDLARAVAFAHEQGVIHRDLKPANVLVNELDEVFITDFGLAKLMHSDAGLTMDGVTLGTPGFMSPEQAAGDIVAQGQASDIYSLGAILFAALTGRPPFKSVLPAQTIIDVIHQEPPFVREFKPEVPRDLDTIVAKCLQKRVSDRYLSAGELADELERFLQEDPIRSRSISSIRIGLRWLSQVPIVAVLTGNFSTRPTIAQKWANKMLAGILILLSLAIVFRSQLRQWYENQILPPTILIASSILSSEEKQPLQSFTQNLELISGRKVIATTSEDSREDMHQLVTGKVNVAIVQGILEHQADISVIAPLYYEAVHILARKSLALHDLRDLKGKRVAIGTHGSSSHQLVETFHHEAPSLFETMLCVDLPWSDLAQRSDLDAAIAVTRPGNPEIQKFLLSSDFELLDIVDSKDFKLANPMLLSYSLSKDTYSSMARSTETLAVPILLAVRNDASNQLVKTCLSALYERGQQTEGLIPLEAAAKWVGIPFHPTARQYIDDLVAKRSVKP